MPAGGKIGNKGGGRKSLYEEHNKATAINKLWEKVKDKVLEGKTLSEYEEKLVLSVLPKTIKTQQDITTNGEKIEGFNFVSNESEHKTNNQAGASVEETAG